MLFSEVSCVLSSRIYLKMFSLKYGTKVNRYQYNKYWLEQFKYFNGFLTFFFSF